MDWSYIAGFFDGEGNFHIVFTKKSIQLVCRMYGDSLEAFNEMAKFMGFGKIYFHKKGTKVPELTITKKEYVKTFLEQTIPFLIVKRNHAKFLLSQYNFGRDNNLNFDMKRFYTFVKRRNAHKFRSKVRVKQIEDRKNYLNRLPNNSSV